MRAQVYALWLDPYETSLNGVLIGLQPTPQRRRGGRTLGLAIDRHMTPAGRAMRRTPPPRRVHYPWIADEPVSQADEPYIRKWPLAVRAAVLLGVSAGLWALIAGAAVAVFAH